MICSSRQTVRVAGRDRLGNRPASGLARRMLGAGTMFSHPRAPLSRIVFAGVLGGLASTVLSGLLGLLTANDARGAVSKVGAGAWQLLRAEGAMVLGTTVLDGGASASAILGAVVVGLLVHLSASVLFAALLDRMIPSLAPLPPATTGLAFALVVYVFDYHVLTILFPWFAAMRGLVAMSVHLTFGLVTALALAAPAPARSGIAPQH